MAMRNAFEELATEGVLRQILRMVSFARDGNDRLRVLVDSAPQFTLYTANSSTSMVGAGTQVAPFNTSSWNVMDAREPMRDQSLMAFQAARNRWSIT